MRRQSVTHVAVVLTSRILPDLLSLRITPAATHATPSSDPHTHLHFIAYDFDNRPCATDWPYASGHEYIIIIITVTRSLAPCRPHTARKYAAADKAPPRACAHLYASNHFHGIITRCPSSPISAYPRSFRACHSCTPHACVHTHYRCGGGRNDGEAVLLPARRRSVCAKECASGGARERFRGGVCVWGGGVVKHSGVCTDASREIEIYAHARARTHTHTHTTRTDGGPKGY